jgi:hypothetical protein
LLAFDAGADEAPKKANLDRKEDEGEEMACTGVKSITPDWVEGGGSEDLLTSNDERVTLVSVVEEMGVLRVQDMNPLLMRAGVGVGGGGETLVRSKEGVPSPPLDVVELDEARFNVGATGGVPLDDDELEPPAEAQVSLSPHNFDASHVPFL